MRNSDWLVAFESSGPENKDLDGKTKQITSTNKHTQINNLSLYKACRAK